MNLQDPDDVPADDSSALTAMPNWSGRTCHHMKQQSVHAVT
ncbi:MAG: hypothetical protein R2713_11980 [Ilumatobacteraceae bacterium]